MSGIAGLLTGLTLRIGRRISEDIKNWSDIPDWIFICLGLVCLFFAGYLAWQDKNDTLKEFQKRLEAPNFNGEIGFSSNGSDSRGDSFMVISGIIRNPLGPASAIVDFTMTIKFPDGRNLDGSIRFPSTTDVEIPLGDQKLILRSESYWPVSGTKPILAGGVLTGWIWAYFNKSDIDEAYKEEASLVLGFSDVVADKKHELVMTFKRAGSKLPPGFHLPSNP